MICDVVKLELLHHEEKPAGFGGRRADLDALRSVPVDAGVCART